MNWLVKKWYSSPVIGYLFSPLSACYRLVIFLRQIAYRLGLKKITRFSAPLIVVGNITVGGTGKTPLVIWIANYLREQGYRPGIVSRGYGGIAKNYPQWVTAQSDPSIVGDEALLIAEKTCCPIVVDPRRVNAVQLLLEKTNCNVVISDDGLQHYALGRDLEIAVIDGARGFGNQFCLPAGPLREPLTRLSSVNFIVTSVIPQYKLVIPRLDRGIHHQFTMQIILERIYNISQPNLTLDPQSVSNQQVHAVAGIGNPQRFFDSLRALGFSIIEHPFPDHYLYKKQDLAFSDNAMVIMTEKDAVKCRKLADERFWCLPIAASLPSGFSEALLASLGSRDELQQDDKVKFC